MQKTKKADVEEYRIKHSSTSAYSLTRPPAVCAELLFI